MTDITFPRPLVQKLLAHAQSQPHQEVCGLISSQHGQPVRHYPIPNCAANPAQQFLMDTTAQLAAQKTLRAAGEELFAIYHSHPTAPAIPSVTDIAECGYPELLYCVISLNTKGVLEMTGWRLPANTTGEAKAVRLKI